MRTSEQTNELSKALAASQGKFPKIGKSHTAEVLMKSGGKYSYSYADLADVLEGIRPVLAAQEIAIVQAPDIEEDTGKLILRTRLTHASGQWVESIYPLPNGGSAQEMGSALTYARRYSLTALAGITAEDDDDGQRAAPTPKREPKPVASRSAPSPLRPPTWGTADVPTAAIINSQVQDTAPPLTSEQEAQWEYRESGTAFDCRAIHKDGRQCINTKPHGKAHVWEEVKGKAGRHQ